MKTPQSLFTKGNYGFKKSKGGYVGNGDGKGFQKIKKLLTIY